MMRARYRHTKAPEESSALQKIQHKIYMAIIMKNVNELTLNPTTFSSMLVLYHLIQCSAAFGSDSLEEIVGIQMKDFAFFVLVFVVAFILIVVLLHGLLFYKTLWSDRHPGLTQLCTHFTLFFVYVVYPLNVMMLATVISEQYLHPEVQNEHFDAHNVQFGLVATAAIGFPIVMASLKMRNDILNASCMCVIDRSTEMLIYASNLMGIIVTSCRPIHYPKSVGYMLVSIVGCLFNLYSLSLITVSKVFWKCHINNLYAAWASRVLLLNIVVSATSGHPTDTQLVMYLLVQMLTSKLVCGISNKLLIINVFDSTLPPKKLAIGITILDQVIKSRADNSLIEMQCKDVVTYYTGLWENHFKTPGKNRAGSLIRKAFGITQTHGSLVQLVRSYNSKSHTLIKLRMKLEMVLTLPFLKTISHANRDLVTVTGNDFFGAFDTFHYQKVLESKLEMMYREEIKESETSKLSLVDIYSFMDIFISNSSTRGDSDSYLDTERPLLAMAKYSRLESDVESCLRNQVVLYEYLDTNSIITSSQLYKHNTGTKWARDKVSGTLKQLFVRDGGADLLSYYYPLMIYFFTFVNYDIKNADWFTYLYQSKLFKLVGACNQWEVINNLRIEIDSIIFRISLDGDSVGRIEDSSLNYADYLGKSPSGSIVGLNINDFMPGKFRAKHMSLMENLERFERLNLHMNSFMNDFHSNLRNAKVCVKISPSIKDSVSAIALTTFHEDKLTCFMLADKNLNIIAANENFKMLLHEAGVQWNEHLPSFNIGKAVRGLGQAISLINVLEKSTKDAAEHKEDLLKDIIIDRKEFAHTAIYDSIKELERLNKTFGLRYAIEPGSELYQLLQDTTVQVKFESGHQMGIPVVKFFMVIESKEYKLKSLARFADMDTHEAAQLNDSNEGNKSTSREKLRDAREVMAANNNGGSIKNSTMSVVRRVEAITETQTFDQVIFHAVEAIEKYIREFVQEEPETFQRPLGGSFKKPESERYIISVRKLESMNSAVNSIDNSFLNVAADLKELMNVISGIVIDEKLISNKPGTSVQEIAQVGISAGIIKGLLKIEENHKGMNYHSLQDFKPLGNAKLIIGSERNYKSPDKHAGLSPSERSQVAEVGVVSPIDPKKFSSLRNQFDFSELEETPKLEVEATPAKPKPYGNLDDKIKFQLVSLDGLPDASGKVKTRLMSKKAIKQPLPSQRYLALQPPYKEKVVGRSQNSQSNLGSQALSETAVKLANSSTIKNLLSRVKARGWDVANRQEQAANDDASSIAHTSTKSKRSSWKKFGSMFLSEPKFSTHSVFVAVLTFYLVLIFGISTILLNQLLIGYFNINQTEFSLYSSLKSTEIDIRVSLMFMSEQATLTYTSLYNDLVPDKATPARLLMRTNLDKQLLVLPSGMNTVSKFLNTLVNLNTDQAANLHNSIELLSSTEQVGRSDQDIIDKIKSTELVLPSDFPGVNPEVYNVATYASIMLASTIFRNNLSTIYANLLDSGRPVDPILPIMKSRFQRMIRILMAPYQSTNTALSDFFSYMTEVGLVAKPKYYKTAFYISHSICLFLFICFTVVTLWLSRRISRSLLRVISIYKHLRPEEIELHRHEYGRRLRLLVETKYHEPKLLSLCMDLNSVSQNVLHKGSENVIGGRAKGSKSHKRVKGLKHDYWFGVIRLILLLIVVVLGVYSGYMILSYKVLYMIDYTNSSLIKYYTTTTDLFMKTIDFFEMHNYYSVYGNGILFFDQLPSVYLKQFEKTDPALELISHLTASRNTFAAYFRPERLAIVNNVIFGDMCKQFLVLGAITPDYYKMCTAIISTQRGLIGLARELSDGARTVREHFEPMKDFLLRSESERFLFENQNFFYSAQYMILRLTICKCFANVIISYSQSSSEYINLTFNETYALMMHVLWVTFTCVFASFSVLFAFLTLVSLKHNLRYCAETAKNLLPEVVFQNKLLQKHVKDTFEHSI